MKRILVLLSLSSITPAMSRQELRSLYKDDERQMMCSVDAQMPTCSICRESGGRVQSLSCHPTHSFHPACIDEWKKQKSECPLCRAPITDSVLCTCIKSLAKPAVCVPGMACMCFFLTQSAPIASKYLSQIDTLSQSLEEHVIGSSCLGLSCIAALCMGTCAYGIEKLKRD